MERRHTVSSGSGVDNEVEMTASGKKKRFRKAYSCRNCRHRKIKCDRTFPCQQCQLRGIDSSCGGDILHQDYANADDKKKQYLRYIDDMQMRRVRSRSTSEGSIGTSAYEPSSQHATPSGLTLDALSRTMETFKSYICQMQHQFDAAHVSSSSSSLHKDFAHRRTQSAISRNMIIKSDSQEQKYDMVLKQVKALELKINMIYERLQQSGTFAPTSTTLASTSISRQPKLTSTMAPQAASRPMTNLVGETEQFHMEGQDIISSHFKEDYNIEFEIDRWLEQECLPIAPINRHLEQDSRRSSTISVAPPLVHMTDHISLQ